MSIEISQLEDWYREKIKEKVQIYTKDSEKICNQLEREIKDIKPVIEAIMDENIKAPEIAVSAAKKLGEKLLELIDYYLTIPSEISYSKIDDLIAEIDKFNSQVFKYGKIWIPQLTKQYKSLLKRLNFYIMQIQKQQENLKDLQKKYHWMKKLESVFERIDILKKELKELKQLLGEEQELKDKINVLNAEINEIETQIKVAGIGDKIRELEEINEKIQDLHTRANSLLNTFQKPFKKISQAMSSGKVRIDASVQSIFYDIMDKPVEVVVGERYPIEKIKKLMSEVQNVLQNKDVGLKSQDVRRALRKIALLRKSRELKEIREEYRNLVNLRKKIEQSKEMNAFYELNKKKEEIIEKRKGLEFQLESVQDKIRDLKNKISNLKQSLEEEIKNNLNEEIEIKLKELN